MESKYLNSARQKLINGGGLSQSPVGPIEKTGGIATLPIDKKENYIKFILRIKPHLIMETRIVTRTKILVEFIAVLKTLHQTRQKVKETIKVR